MTLRLFCGIVVILFSIFVRRMSMAHRILKNSAVLSDPLLSIKETVLQHYLYYLFIKCMMNEI
jgi:hypothetical protein